MDENLNQVVEKMCVPHMLVNNYNCEYCIFTKYFKTKHRLAQFQMLGDYYGTDHLNDQLVDKERIGHDWESIQLWIDGLVIEAEKYFELRIDVDNAIASIKAYVDDEISAIKKYLESGLEQDDLDSELADEAAAHKKRKAEVLRIKADEGHAEAKAGQSSKGPNETDKVASAEADTQSKSGVMETITDQQTANSKPSGVSQIQAKEADVLALAELTRALDKKEEKKALEDHHKGQEKRFNATTAILQRAVKDVTRRGGGGRGPRGGRWH